MINKKPIYLIASLIIGGGLAGLTAPLEAAFPHSGYVSGAAAIIVWGAGLVKTYYDLLNAPAPALAVTADGNIPVVNAATGEQTAASVVTTTSTLPFVAPSAGAKSK